MSAVWSLTGGKRTWRLRGPTSEIDPTRTLALARDQPAMLLCVGQFGHTGVSLADERVERRLVAVLAADVAGYSRLMGADEEGTLAQLKAIRKALVDPTIAAHRGRIVKTTGDGMLVEFASAVDAARGAAEVQRAMAKQNTNVPLDARIELRMGIHVGDIIIDDGDIFGDGVGANFATRWVVQGCYTSGIRNACSQRVPCCGARSLRF